MNRCVLAVVAAAGVAAAASSAQAGAVFSWTYNNLSGNFVRNMGANSATLLGQFTATAVDGTLRSSGSLSRNTAPLSQADFQAGFVTLNAPAGAVLTVNVSNPSGNTADGTGTLTLRDTNNDTITANFNGTWNLFPGGGVFFNASSVSYTISNPSGDGRFDGSNGSFAAITGLTGSLTGVLNQLFIDMSSPTTIAQAFGASFSNVSSTATGQIVPTPGSAALLGVAGLVIARRRRN